MVHTFNPGALEAGAGGLLQVQGQPGQDGKFQTNYILSCCSACTCLRYIYVFFCHFLEGPFPDFLKGSILKLDSILMSQEFCPGSLLTLVTLAEMTLLSVF